MQFKFAGSMSVPVISQALGILASEGLAIFDDEEGYKDIDPDVIVLALAGEKARIPSHFLRVLSDDIAKRRQQVENHSLGIENQVIEIPKLVLIRRPSCSDPASLYVGNDLAGFEAALKNLAGIKPPKLKRNRGRTHIHRAYGGLVPELN
jgi:hypothetical protein